MSSQSKFYAVAKGHNPGIYTDWPTTNENVKGFSGAVYESFGTIAEAEQFIKDYNLMNPLVTTKSTTRLNTLTDKQLLVIDLLLKGDNVALMGAAGCGKSYLLSVIYEEFPGLKKRLMASKYTGINGVVPKLARIQLCALTGCAALLLGCQAKTLHSWAGIGLGKGSISELYTKIRRNQRAMRNWLCTDLLIIDEISMMTAELLDKLNQLAKKVRGNIKPFGGMQVMFVGDFYQLPPVNKSDDETRFAFESDAWKEIVKSSVELDQIKRQTDETFQKVLKEARMGAISRESCAILRAREGLEWRNNKIRPTLIFPKRAEVDMINDSNLRALTGRRYRYAARLAYDGKMPEGFSENNEGFLRALNMMDSEGAYVKDLELMLNAQVMLIANIDPEKGLVNGSRGIVVGFCEATELPIVEFLNGMKMTISTHGWPIEDYEFVSRTQVPLRLAFAITIHKCQGATLDSALVDIGAGIFEYGQAYVALSRVRSLDALYVYDFDPKAFKAHPKVKEFYKTLETSSISPENMTHIHAAKFDSVEAFLADSKPIITEMAKPIQAIIVNKTDISSESTTSIPSDNWLYESAPTGWKTVLEPCKDKLAELSATLSSKEYLPAKENIWRALELTHLSSIKVVILGQDPYPTPGNAHGLAFSVLPDIRPLPASLKNIYKELVSDIGFVAPVHGNLEAWAKQGVLLLNTVLTVEAGAPQSHIKIGWEEVTDQIIRAIAAQCKNVVFVLWGKSAQVKKKLLGLYMNSNGHRVFESAHPSPLSASKGFFGSRPFSTVNKWLTEMGGEALDWTL
jgi:ATP-dependent DNA helicase PIF1